jgi:hypothetical protein
MLAKGKDFIEREAEVRESFEPLLSVTDVKRILGCSIPVVIELVRAGRIQAYHLDGTTVQRADVTERTYGIRILPSSLEDYLETIRIR